MYTLYNQRLCYLNKSFTVKVWNLKKCRWKEIRKKKTHINTKMKKKYLNEHWWCSNPPTGLPSSDPVKHVFTARYDSGSAMERLRCIMLVTGWKSKYQYLSVFFYHPLPSLPSSIYMCSLQWRGPWSTVSPVPSHVRWVVWVVAILSTALTDGAPPIQAYS